MSESSGPEPPSADGAPSGAPVPYSRGTAGLSSKQAWGTGVMGAVDANALSPEEAVAKELEEIRARNPFGDLAESLPDGSPPRRAVEAVARSFGLQLVAAVFGYLGCAVAFRVLVGAAVETLQGLNFFLFLYLLGAAIYFGRYGVRGAMASVVLLLVAILAYAVQLSGFRPSIFFLVTHPMVAVASAAILTPLMETAAYKTVIAETNRRQVLALEGRQKNAGQGDDDILTRMKEAEVRTVQMRTQFSDLLNNLRDLGGAYRESDIYSTLFRLLKKGGGAEAADVWFMNEGATALVCQEARVAGGADMVVTEFTGSLPHDASSIVSFCARQERAILPAEIARDPSLKSLQTKGAHPTTACFPVMVEGKVRGVVNISRGPKEIDAQQVALLNTISQIVSKAFESAATFRLSETERAAAVNLSEQERAERIKTRETLERFVSKNVVDDVMANPKLSQNMETTILLADLRGFTTISERHEPEVIVEMLNDYFGVLTPLIFDYGGTLDKYIGDMVMALFGPPRPTGQDAVAAVRCAAQMRNAFDKVFRRKWEPRIQSKLEMGIALNTGPATVGLLGSERLVNYTAIGDAVNTASRLEDLTPAGRILMTEATFLKVQTVVEAKMVGAKSFKGKTERTKIYELRGLRAQTGPEMPDPTATPPAPAAPPPVALASGGLPAFSRSDDPALQSGMSFPDPALASGMKPIPPAAAARRPAPPAPAPAPPRPAPPPPRAAPASAAPCPLCQAAVPVGSQACPTCGMKL